MRPRVFPAEDGLLVFLLDLNKVGFNEAAGIPRGRLGRLSSAPPDHASLQ